MRDLKILWAYFKEHIIGALIVLLAIFIGAALGRRPITTDGSDKVENSTEKWPAAFNPFGVGRRLFERWGWTRRFLPAILRVTAGPNERTDTENPDKNEVQKA